MRVPFAIVSVILAGAACGSTSDTTTSTPDAGTPDAANTATDSGSPALDASTIDAADASAPDAVADADGAVGHCDGGAVCPVNLNALVAANPGLTVEWNEFQPCDSVEIEWETMLVPYPSQGTPVGPPNFTAPGSATQYTDTGATNTGTFYTYHARCVVAGVRSDWSNELAARGTN